MKASKCDQEIASQCVKVLAFEDGDRKMMKRIVDGVAYNTDTSTWIARSQWSHEDDRGREVHVMAIMFQTTKGAYFLDKTSKLVTHARDNKNRESEEIIPMTADEAKAWMLKGQVEVFHDPFAEGIPEAEAGATIYLRVPATLKQRVETAADAVGLSCNAWLIKCLEVGLTNPLVHLGPVPSHYHRDRPPLVQRALQNLANSDSDD